MLSQAQAETDAGAAPTPAHPVRKTRIQIGAIAIGASTGGPQALVQILRTLAGGKLNVPVLVAIHTPAEFCQSVAAMLERESGREVVVVKALQTVRPDVIYLPSGNMHLRVMKRLGAAYVDSCAAPGNVRYRPSVDVLFDSAAYVYGPRLMGIVLTGMGEDGLQGARAIAAAGGCILAQALTTCVVDSMPAAILAAGLTHKSDPPEEIAAQILLRTGQQSHVK